MQIWPAEQAHGGGGAQEMQSDMVARYREKESSKGELYNGSSGERRFKAFGAILRLRGAVSKLALRTAHRHA